ncbi:MAG: BrnT family toxin [Solirubrobacteraceae bacterium]
MAAAQSTTPGEAEQVEPGRASGSPGRPPEFEWDEYNEDKLMDNHGVSALEAEQCFAHPHTKRRKGDDLLLLGATDGGRMLFLVYEQKPEGVVRVYSAREMTDRERGTYRRHVR